MNAKSVAHGGVFCATSVNILHNRMPEVKGYAEQQLCRVLDEFNFSFLSCAQCRIRSTRLSLQTTSSPAAALPKLFCTGCQPPLVGLLSHQTVPTKVSQAVLPKVDQEVVAGGRSRQGTESELTAPLKRLPSHRKVPLRLDTVQ